MGGDYKKSPKVSRGGASKKPEKLTVNVLIDEATSSKFKLTQDQIEQVKILLRHNDSCSTPRHKVSLIKAWRFLRQHYALKMGIHMFERLVCDELKRTSWGQP